MWRINDGENVQCKGSLIQELAEKREKGGKHSWKQSGTAEAAVLWWPWCNRLNRRRRSAETQTVGKGIDKPVYRQIFCVQYSCVTSSAHFCEGFFSCYFFVIFFSVFRLAFSDASQPSVVHPIATCARGKAAWRAALPTVLEMVLTAWELLPVP